MTGILDMNNLSRRLSSGNAATLKGRTPLLTRIRMTMVTLAIASVLSVTGCGESNERASDQPNMIFSSKEFERGRNDGRRDAGWSMTDASAGWTWLWMTQRAYQQGYQQGWKEGRNEAKFKKEQERARRDAKSQDEAGKSSTPTTE